MLITNPAVFAVGEDYQIMVPVSRAALVWVQIGDECYYDEANGIMRSFENIHRVSVPMAALDAAGEYTLFVRPVIERKPYFTETEEPVSYHYCFYPVSGDTVRVFQVADAHGRIDEPVRAAETFGQIDLLILNGDILNHSGDPSKFLNVYEICSRILGGERPVVFSRGNHDLRGEYAEKFADYTPNRNGYTYYTFRLGCLWGIVLDCGEDKDDAHAEYGHTVACRQFRRKETAYIDSVIASADREYAAPGVRHRIAVCHVPFTRIDKPPFDIEQDTYGSWVKKLNEHIKPSLLICGHTHTLDIVMPGDPLDSFGQKFPVFIGSKPEEESFTGSGCILSDTGMEIVFADNLGNSFGKTFGPVLNK